MKTVLLLVLALTAIPVAAQDLKPADSKDRVRAEIFLARGIALDIASRKAAADLAHSRALLDAEAVAFIETMRLKLHASSTDVWDWHLCAFLPKPADPPKPDAKADPPKDAK